MEIDSEYDKIMEEFKSIIIFNKTNIEEIIKCSSDLIKKPLCSPIPDDYIQNVIFSNQQNKIYEKKVE